MGYGEGMTISGTVNKTGILLILVVASAAWTWNRFTNLGPTSVMGLIGIGAIGGLIFALITVFKKTWAPVTAPIYALLEGLVLGGVSAIYELQFKGIPMQAVGLTFGTLVAFCSSTARASSRSPTSSVWASLPPPAASPPSTLLTWILSFFHIHLPVNLWSRSIGHRHQCRRSHCGRPESGFGLRLHRERRPRWRA